MTKLAELGLNSYQPEQLTAIPAKRREIMDKVREAMSCREEGVDRGALRDEVRAVREQTNTEIRDLLTADQYAAFLRMDSDARGPGRGRGGRDR